MIKSHLIYRAILVISSVVFLTGAWAKDDRLPDQLSGDLAACDDGNMDACYNASLSYQGGNGIEPDYRKMTELLSRACSGCLLYTSPSPRDS